MEEFFPLTEKLLRHTFFSFVPEASQSRLLCQSEGAFPQGFVVSQSCGSKRLDSSLDMSN
jgi:hypothetical protein